MVPIGLGGRTRWDPSSGPANAKLWAPPEVWAIVQDRCLRGGLGTLTAAPGGPAHSLLGRPTAPQPSCPGRACTMEACSWGTRNILRERSREGKNVYISGFASHASPTANIDFIPKAPTEPGTSDSSSPGGGRPLCPALALRRPHGLGPVLHAFGLLERLTESSAPVIFQG